MKKTLFFCFIVGCQPVQEQGGKYTFSDYQSDLLEYQTRYESQEILVIGNQEKGYTVQAYLLDSLVYR